MRTRTGTTPATNEAPSPPEDFGAVYDEHFPDIYRYIAGRLGRDVADDIAADTFVVALRRWQVEGRPRRHARRTPIGIARLHGDGASSARNRGRA